MRKPGPKPNPVLENRIRLNAGKVATIELALLLNMGHTALVSKAARMGVSLRVRKEKV